MDYSDYNIFSVLSNCCTYFDEISFNALEECAGSEVRSDVISDILAYQHSAKTKTNNARLNGTLPTAPESAATLRIEGLGSEKDKLDTLIDVADGTSAANAARQLTARKIPPNVRVAEILTRHTTRALDSHDPDSYMLHWLVLSSAVPSWKLKVLDHYLNSQDKMVLSVGGDPIHVEVLRSVIVSCTSRWVSRLTDFEQSAVVAASRAVSEGDVVEPLEFASLGWFDEADSSWLCRYTLWHGKNVSDHATYLNKLSALHTQGKIRYHDVDDEPDNE